MPRRIVVPKKEVYRRRGDHWAWHYQHRELAKQYSTSDMERVSTIIAREVPTPEMLVDGDALRGIETLRGEERALRALGMTRESRSLMCIWYWSEAAWMEYVREFQALPDVVEDYYFVYDEQADAARLEPISTRQKTGKKLLGTTLGTSQVHIRYKSPLVPNTVDV